MLKHIHLDVHPGEVVCVIGPSGSGKSTLLRCVNLLETPTGGKVFIGADEVTDADVDIDKVRRRIGMVFQSFNLFPHLTVLKNLTIAQTKVLKRSSAEAEKIARKNLERVGIAAQGGRIPGAALRWAAAARRDRPVAVHVAGPDAVRRAHLRARPRAGR